jgi:transcriptional regulator with XRE-family HTH domain
MEIEPGEPYMSYGSVQRIVTGAQSPTWEQLAWIAHALDVTVWDLANVNPLVEGDVIDLIRRLDSRDREKAVMVIRAMAG